MLGSEGGRIHYDRERGGRDVSAKVGGGKREEKRKKTYRWNTVVTE